MKNEILYLLAVLVFSSFVIDEGYSIHEECDPLKLIRAKGNLEHVGKNIDTYTKDYFSSQFPGVTENSPNYEEALKATQNIVFSDPNGLKIFLDANYYIDNICHGDSSSVYQLSDFSMEVLRANTFHFLNRVYPYEGMTVQEFCENSQFLSSSFDYMEQIETVEGKLMALMFVNPTASMEEKGALVITPHLEEIGQKAACMRDPNSVREFNPEVQEVFMANYDKLQATAPTLVKHATVPEFGTVALIALGFSVTLTVAMSRKFGKL